jgi:hypothetical protein
MGFSALKPLCHLSTMALSELLEADLARWAECVGTNDRLPTDERAEIDARELLGASRAERRVKDVARRTPDGKEPGGPASIARSGHVRTVDGESRRGEFGLVL